MGTQPHLCSFSYQTYKDKVRPAFYSILVGEWPSWVNKQYQHNYRFQNMKRKFSRICPQKTFDECVCFTRDLKLELPACDIFIDEWNDSQLLRFFEKMLLDECVIEQTYLAKKLTYIHLRKEELTELGLGGEEFQHLLQHLCNRWEGSWIDVDNSGPGGYLKPAEAKRFHRLLSHDLSNCVEAKSYYLEDICAINQFTEPAVKSNYGLLWVHDLLSVYWR